MVSPHLPQVTLWVTKLALLTSGGRTPVTKQQIGLHALTLSSEVPIAAFTDDSLRLIAGSNEFFPAYAPLKAKLEAWLDAQASRNRLTFVPPEALQQRIDELTDNKAYFRRLDEERGYAKADWTDPAKVRASVRKIGDDHPMGHMLRTLLAGLVKKHAPQNLEHIPPGWQEREAGEFP